MLSLKKILIASGFILAASSLSQASIEGGVQMTSQSTVSSVGEAELQVDPDAATMLATVTTRGKTVAAALATNATQSKALIDSLTSKFGLQKTDWKNNVSESKDVKWSTDGRTVISTEEVVRNTFTFKISKLDQIGPMIDAIGAVGAEAGYVTYGLKNAQAVKAAALQAAAVNAQANAEALLKAYGKHVGGPLEIVQSGAHAPIRQVSAAQARSMPAPAPGGGVPTDVSSGQITVTASVTVIFQIVP